VGTNQTHRFQKQQILLNK